jgi:membrane protein DedA with SNARE-associated domain
MIIQHLISQYGYPGIFILLVLGIVGIPIPDETLLLFSGYLIYKGTLSIIPTFISAYLGSIIGISLSYIIGRTFGYRVLMKYGHYIHVTENKLQKVHKWFEKIGKLLLLIGYFIPGVRHIVAIVAGVSKLKTWEFTLFAYTGGLIWITTFLSIGYIFGERWKDIHRLVKHKFAIISIAIIILLIVIYYLNKKYRASKQQSE